MKRFISQGAVLFFLVPACAFSATNVVNLSHYDMMRPDFTTMKRARHCWCDSRSDVSAASFATQSIWTGKWGHCKRDCSGEHITTLTEVIQFGRLIISSVLSPVPGHKPILRCDRAQVSCWYSISKRMVTIPGERCAPTRPSRLSNAFAHAPVYIPAFIRANIISRQVLNSRASNSCSEKNADQLLALGCKLLQRTACNGAVELLGSVAILR